MNDESVKKGDGAKKEGRNGCSPAPGLVGTKNAVPRPAFMVAIVIGSLYLVEVVIMNFFHEFAETAHGTMDALILTAVLLPLLYFFIYRPFSRSVKDLKALSGTLERQVRERTVQLEFSEALHRAVIASSADAIIQINVDGVILMANPAAYWMLGYGKTELENKHISLLLPGGYERVLVEGFAASLDGWDGHRAAPVAEAVAVTKSGKKLTVECTSSECLVNSEISFVIDMRDVSERRKAEKELTSIMEAQPDILYVINPQGALIKWNSALQELCGLTRDQMTGRLAADFVCEEDRPVVYEGIKEVFEKGSASIEARFIRHDGTLVPHLCNGAVWKNLDGEPIGFIGVGKDISERKKAEEALRESEARFRLLSDLSFEGISISVKGKIVDANTTLAQMAGYTLDEIIGKNVFDITTPESHAVIMEHINKGIESPPYEVTGIRKDGSLFRAEVKGHNILYRGQMARGTAIRDITERVKTEQALRESEGRYRQFSEASFEGIVINIDGKVVDCNSAFARMFGYEPNEIIGTIPVDLSPPESQAIIMDHIRRGSEEVYDVMGRKKDGTLFPIEMQGRAILYHGQKARFTAMRDISERKKRDEELELFRLIVEKSGDPIFMIDDDDGCRMMYVNEAAIKHYGATREEIMTWRIPDWDPNFSYEMLPQHVEDIKKLKNLTIESRHRVKGGSIVPVEITLNYLFYRGRICHFGYFRNISERKAAEQAIRESEGRYHQLSEASFEGIVIAVDGKIVDANNVFAGMFGYTPDEIIGKTPLDLLPPESYAIAADHIGRESEEPYETVGRKKNGTLFPIEVRGRGTFFHGQKARVTAIRDITGRKEAEKAIQMMSLFPKFNPGPILRCDADGVIQMANPAALAVFGSKDLSGVKVQTILSDLGMIDLRSIIRDDSLVYFTTVVNEGYFQFAIKGVAELGGLNIYGGDITAIKKAEDNLRASEQRFRAVAQSASDAIISINGAEEIIHWNKGAEKMFGHAESEALGKPVGLLIPRRYAEAHRQGLARAAAGGPFRLIGKTVALEGLRKDGAEFPLELSLAAWDEGGETYFSAIIRDITERKAAEEKLKTAKEAAEEANKLKDKFLSLVSHDLKTPLASMIGFLKLVRHDYAEPLNDGAKMILDRAVDSGEAMVHLIDDLLTISRFSTGQLKLNRQFFDAEYLGVIMAGNYSHMARQKGIEIESLIPSYSRIYADKTLLAEALGNLVTNAIKFCKSGDHIAISLAGGDAPAICVRDTGPGIQPKLLNDLFRFDKKTSTIGTAGETGTGFGLPLVKNIMELHGGNLELNSEPGKGCLFCLKLPYVRPKILLVDDDKNSRLLQMLQLMEMKADIIEAENGEDALNTMASIRPDLVITDIQMPVMDGLELLKRIKSAPETRDIPVIVQSGEFGMEIRDTIFKFGGDDFVTKNKTDKVDFFPRVRRFIG